MFAVSLALSSLGLALLGFLGHRRRRKREQRRERRASHWSIGWQRSTMPFRWDPPSARVFDRTQAGESVRTLADPFVVERQGELFLFHEVALKSSSQAKIGVSVHDATRDAWRYEGIVLDEPFHLSYPYVFCDGPDVYMLPETKGARSVRLYKASAFPRKWELERVLLDEVRLVDPSIVRWNERWYLFASRKRRLYLYHADSLHGDWKLHRKSPLRWFNYARGAGRIIAHDGALYRFAQEQSQGYGTAVHLFRILELSGERYREERLGAGPLLGPWGQGWARNGMHHIDVLQLGPSEYLGVFDGRGVSVGVAD